MRDGVSRGFYDPGSFGAANCVSLSPNGNHVASAHEDRIVRIWDMRAGQLVGTLRGHTDWVRSVAFMLDGKGLVSGSEDNTSKYWDMSLLSTLRPGEKAPLNFEREVEDGLMRHTRLGIRRERSSPLKLEFLGHKVLVFFENILSESF
jgi:WD40 repeat protein